MKEFIFISLSFFIQLSLSKKTKTNLFYKNFGRQKSSDLDSGFTNTSTNDSDTSNKSISISFKSSSHINHKQYKSIHTNSHQQNHNNHKQIEYYSGNNTCSDVNSSGFDSAHNSSSPIHSTKTSIRKSKSKDNIDRLSDCLVDARVDLQQVNPYRDRRTRLSRHLDNVKSSEDEGELNSDEIEEDIYQAPNVTKENLRKNKAQREQLIKPLDITHRVNQIKSSVYKTNSCPYDHESGRPGLERRLSNSSLGSNSSSGYDYNYGVVSLRQPTEIF